MKIRLARSQKNTCSEKSSGPWSRTYLHENKTRTTKVSEKVVLNESNLVMDGFAYTEGKKRRPRSQEKKKK